MSQRSLPHGSWPSRIDADDVARNDGAPNWPSALDDEVYWTEPRPAENGRVTLCRTRLGGFSDAVETVLPDPWNVRSRVHEYGGRPYALARGARGTAVVFSEFSDQRLYLVEPDGQAPPVPITPTPDVACAWRYVEPITAPGDEVWCVRETRTGPAPTDVERAIVAVPLDGSAAGDPAAVREVASGHRFLACPRVAPDGRHLSWIGWDHPSMPWDSTELTVAELGEDGRARHARTLAGGPGESVVQAEWASETTLHCVSDASGWWNPHEVTLAASGEEQRAPVNLVAREEEFGGPLWQLGQRWVLALRDGRLAAVHGREATSLGLVCPDSGGIEDLPTPHTEWMPKLALAGSAGGTLVCVAASPRLPAEVVAVSLTDGSWRSLSRPDAAPNESPADEFADHLPEPRARVFAGVGGREVHASVYPPRNPDFTGAPSETPPYVVWAHGGPTNRAPMVHDLEVAYFTSRGIGVVEVNYGGSTGFGRAYRERLRESWGVVDVEDCVSVARALAEEGAADPERLAIRGGSAGGWTSAATLAFTSVFCCGTIQYPILDLSGWRTGETHDFESQYLESLVGPWPQRKDRYEERSPVNHADTVSVPFVLLQGLEDEICPPVQCERFLQRLRGRGVRHAYLTFEGEQHGFRKATTIRSALLAELSLYAQVFGFETDAPALPLRP